MRRCGEKKWMMRRGAVTFFVSVVTLAEIMMKLVKLHGMWKIYVFYVLYDLTSFFFCLKCYMVRAALSLFFVFV